MKKGIVYNLFKTGSTEGLIQCINELNLSIESAKYYNYPKCLLLSNKISKSERDKIDLYKFDEVIEYTQRFNNLSDKLLSYLYTPFDRNILIDSDIIFLNEKSYDILKFPPNILLEIPTFDIDHLFDHKFALCFDRWFFKKPFKQNNNIKYTYNPLSFEFLYQKYKFRKNIFTYNNSVVVFDRTDKMIEKVFNESLDNAQYLYDVRNSTGIPFNACDQVCLDFAIENNKYYPTLIHPIFQGVITIKDNNLILHNPAIMAHSSNAMKYMKENNIRIF